ncbi:hypothetical protein [Paenibacillus sp. YN15]|uniref:hypothetical protein n=1 Tax=Paenibacillus sp. YN15 TaxID=1742774 RepID=UPI000DCF6211|nr:hypothetical protein [Paenibacillus sp. YN15]RAV02720.1 hypothetical protein DQG13_09465 [Paenibacillus sp. YN15]
MAENLFILGAGASFDAGAPLMNGFFDKAYELLGSGMVQSFEVDFKDVFKLLKELRLVYANSHLDLHNIESLFGAIEMGKIINLLGLRTGDEIEKVRKSLVRLIVATLEGSMQFPKSEGSLRPTESYSRFAKLISERLRSSSIITFNYDIGLDYALNFHDVPYTYCIDQEGSIGEVKLMKLHGSVNWALCRTCGTILPIPIAVTKYLSSIPGRGGPQIQFTDKIARHEHKPCKGGISACEDVPVIVPPTWNKKDYHGNLTNVWKQAAKELSQARNIYVIGYSLPESDAFFRYLFALDTFDNDTIKRFWVYNPDSSAETKSRYNSLLGKGISIRYEYKEKKFADAIADLTNMKG